jgi:hypothetical protein
MSVVIADLPRTVAAVNIVQLRTERFEAGRS